jgi:hypothetical protein
MKCYVVIYDYYDEFKIGGVFTSYVDAVEFARTEWKSDRPDEHIHETVLKED